MNDQALATLTTYALDPFELAALETITGPLATTTLAELTQLLTSPPPGRGNDRFVACPVCSDPGEDPFPETAGSPQSNGRLFPRDRFRDLL